jgi:hypothetical protein
MCVNVRRHYTGALVVHKRPFVPGYCEAHEALSNMAKIFSRQRRGRMLLKFRQSLEQTQICFETHWRFKPKINVLAAKLAVNCRYALLIGPVNVSASFGVIHFVLEVQVSRNLKRKIIKFEHNLIITPRWLQFESKKSAVMESSY